MTIIDPQTVAAIIREVAETEILPRFGRLSAGQIREKKPGQLVTEADTEAERVLAARLTALLPDSKVVGEESVDADPALLDRLRHPGTIWIIDPVDGTSNFAQANPRFAVILALVVDGITRQGWIHDPVADRTVMAETGQGAWMDGRRLSVLPSVPLAQMAGSVKRASHLVGKVAKIGRQGSAAHDYLDLVTGGLHFAHFSRLMPWDHAAGVLIHAEAGGVGRLTTGEAYRPVASRDSLLLAPSEDSWRSLKTLLRG